MKISKNFIQYVKNDVLLLVAGQYSAKFYLTHNGQIKEVDDVKIEKPEYTDREGFFESSTRGQILGTGSVYEYQKQAIIQDFLHEVIAHTKQTAKKHKINKVVLFSPEYMKIFIENSLPKSLQSKIGLYVAGNFNHTHPFGLLKKIVANVQNKEVKPIKSEAKKIFDKIK